MSSAFTFFPFPHRMEADVPMGTDFGEAVWKGKMKMSECIIAMKSVTYAEKAKRAARSAGIGGQIVSLDPSVTARGCAYGISLPCREVRSLLSLLDQKKIPYGEVLGDDYYKLSDNNYK